MDVAIDFPSIPNIFALSNGSNIPAKPAFRLGLSGFCMFGTLALFDAPMVAPPKLDGAVVFSGDDGFAFIIVI